jgi:hypothetical protein
MAIRQQRAYFSLTEKNLDFAPFLLRFNKGMYLMQGPSQ